MPRSESESSARIRKRTRPRGVGLLRIITENEPITVGWILLESYNWSTFIDPAGCLIDYGFSLMSVGGTDSDTGTTTSTMMSEFEVCQINCEERYESNNSKKTIEARD